MSSEARVVGELWARGGAAWQHFLDLRNPKEHLDQLITLAGGDENIKTIVDVIEQSKSQEDQIEQLITSLPSK